MCDLFFTIHSASPSKPEKLIVKTENFWIKAFCSVVQGKQLIFYFTLWLVSKVVHSVNILWTGRLRIFRDNIGLLQIMTQLSFQKQTINNFLTILNSLTSFVEQDWKVFFKLFNCLTHFSKILRFILRLWIYISINSHPHLILK